MTYKPLSLEVTGCTVTLIIGKDKLARTFEGENEAAQKFGMLQEEIKKQLILLMG